MHLAVKKSARVVCHIVLKLVNNLAKFLVKSFFPSDVWQMGEKSSDFDPS